MQTSTTGKPARTWATNSDDARVVRGRVRALKPRSVLLFAGAAAATIAFVLIAVDVVEGRADAMDRTVELALHDLASPALDAVMNAVTSLGAAPHILGVIAIFALCAIERRYDRAAFVLAVNWVVVECVNLLLKELVGRHRPVLFAGAELHASYSFPSGHAMVSTAVYGVIAAVTAALWPRARPFAIAAAIAVILLIGVSRVYLGAHWPSDVVAGFGAGIPFVVVGAHLIGRPPTTRSAPSTSSRRSRSSRPGCR